jgi:hypothetical protein
MLSKEVFGHYILTLFPNRLMSSPLNVKSSGLSAEIFPSPPGISMTYFGDDQPESTECNG